MSPLDVDRDALVRLFLEESREGLAAMEEALVVIEQGVDRGDALKTLFREAHTLKANATSLGFSEIAEIAHEIEDVLHRMRGGTLALTKQITDLLLASVVALRELLETQA